MLNENACWAAVVARDRGHSVSFVYGVRTTGVYCRPGCSSRTPLRRNVSFFATAAEAAQAGLRACHRCRPDASDGRSVGQQTMEDLRAYLDANFDGSSDVSLASLSLRFGYAESHLLRSFRALTGVTPRQYVQAHRVTALKRSLQEGARVTAASMDAGFSSASRLHAAAEGELAMTPLEYRSGGRGLRIEWLCIDTSLGLVLLAATGRGICFVQFGDNAAQLEHQLRDEYPAAEVARYSRDAGDPRFEAWVADMQRLVRGEAAQGALPLHVRGTAFQQRVWRALAAVPAGQTCSYTSLAAAAGNATAVRAAASACAANPAAVVIPCHRAVRSTGELSGYRWGTERKQKLLAAEREHNSFTVHN